MLATMTTPEPMLQQATPELSDREDHDMGQKLNWLRAGVLGANDGIVSVAGVIIGMAGATHQLSTIMAAGSAALVAGALSMAGGEYVSVSTQRDTERAVLATVKRHLDAAPEAALNDLTDELRQMGMSQAIAREAAEDLTQRDALAAHAKLDYGVTPGDLTNPWIAAFSSLVAFTCGAMLPLLVTLLPLDGFRVIATMLSVVVGLFITGYVSSRLGDAPSARAVLRNIVMGVITMVATYGIGLIFHTVR